MAPAEPVSDTVRVEVVWDAAPHAVRRVPLVLPAGCTAAGALAASGLLALVPGLAQWPVGVWGRAVDPDQPLRDGDRVELYRALTVDPKEARRRRQGRGKPGRPRAG